MMPQGRYELLAVAIILLNFSACATLAPKEERQAQFIENTQATKATAFNRALAYIAKNWGDRTRTAAKSSSRVTPPATPSVRPGM
jgi:hypothetical protein